MGEVQGRPDYAHSWNDSLAGDRLCWWVDAVCEFETHIYFAKRRRQAGEDPLQLQTGPKGRKPGDPAAPRRHNRYPMKDVMKFRLAASALLLMMGPLSYGQAVPTGGTAMTSGSGGPNSPSLDGIVHYALSASEVIQLGYDGLASDPFDGVVRRRCLSGEEHRSTVQPALCGRRHSGQPIGARDNVLYQRFCFTGVCNAKLVVQYIGFIQLSATIANNRSVGYSRRRRPWLDASAGACGRAGRRNIFDFRQPNRQ